MSTGARSVKNAAYFQAIVPGKAQSIAFTNTSQQSLAMETDTTLVRLFATQDCYVAIGDNPTAVAPGVGAKADRTVFIAGGIYEYIGIEAGEKIAVIRDTVSGTLHITEGAEV